MESFVDSQEQLQSFIDEQKQSYDAGKKIQGESWDPSADVRARRHFRNFINTSELCGATGNCPMALYLPGERGLHGALHFGGWGFSLLPSGGDVPDIVDAWNMSAGEEILNRFRFK
jgi:hypothetical protein